jgi:RecA-family ATPase
MTKDLNATLIGNRIDATRDHLDDSVLVERDWLDINNEPRPPSWRTLPLMNMSNWDCEAVPQRDWVILNRVPAEQFGIFSGEGGTGKSIIELTKNVAHVTGKDWLGSLPEPGPTIYIGTEDSVKELHIRLAAIATYLGVTFAEIVAAGFYVLPLLEENATLVTMSRGGKIEPTPLYHQIYEMAGDVKPINVSIDPLTSVFGGNEIDRVQVYQFRRYMMAIARASRTERRTGAVFGGSVTVLSHPSLSGMASGSGLSGSTAWHGAPRFRQYLTGVRAEDPEQPDDDLRQLHFKKNQYGPVGESVVLRYQNGVFMPVKGVSDIERAAIEAKADDVFILLLKRFTNAGRNVSHKSRSSNYGPAQFAGQSEAKDARLRKADFERAMERLFEADKIHIESYGREDRDASRLGVGSRAIK